MENLKAIVEALIFVSEVPLSAARIKEALGNCEKSEVVNAIDELAREYEERPGGICLQEVAGGYQFRTRPDMGTWIKKLKGGKPIALSQPAMETLAIIAYRQPVVKADIERMRGVDVGGPLKGLLDKKLIRIVGRKDVPGKPMLYGTTKKFLEIFNLSDLTELPTLRELKELQESKGSESYELDDIQAGEAPLEQPSPEAQAPEQLESAPEEDTEETVELTELEMELAAEEAALGLDGPPEHLSEQAAVVPEIRAAEAQAPEPADPQEEEKPRVVGEIQEDPEPQEGPLNG